MRPHPMTGLMQRIFRRRAADPPLADPPLAEAAPEATPLPAGVDPEVVLPEHPSFRDRGRMRRRLRYLRRARELGFRDLGGLVFDLRRFGREREDLVEAKVRALFAVDRELRALETALNARIPIHELREPGVTSCPHCGALHGSDARFCPACGTPLRGPRAVAEVGEGLLPVGLGAPSPQGDPEIEDRAGGAEDPHAGEARGDGARERLFGHETSGAPASEPLLEGEREPEPSGGRGAESLFDDHGGERGSESLFGDPREEREALELGLDSAFVGGPEAHPDEGTARRDEPAPFPEDAEPPTGELHEGERSPNGDPLGARRRPDERPG